MDASFNIRPATPADSGTLLPLQKSAYLSEAERYLDWSLPVLFETTAAFLSALQTHTILVCVQGDELVGAIRANMDEGVCRIGRLFTAPDFQGRGIGSALLRAIEEGFGTANRFVLFTGSASHGNIKLYRKHGYEITGRDQMTEKIEMVILEKTNPKAGMDRPYEKHKPVSRLDIAIDAAARSDAEQILSLQKIAFRREAELNGDLNIAPMAEGLDELQRAYETHTLLVGRLGGVIIGSVRARVDAGTCHIGRLFVSPDYQGQGIGRRLFQAAEQQFPDAGSFRLITGKLSTGNIRLYESLGYRIAGEMMENDTTPLVIMEKQAGG